MLTVRSILDRGHSSTLRTPARCPSHLNTSARLHDICTARLATTVGGGAAGGAGGCWLVLDGWLALGRHGVCVCVCEHHPSRRQYLV
jgi:hypothetical protein